MMMDSPFILGVAGGSGSGKTYFARELVETLGEKVCSLIYQDDFYRDQSEKFDHDGGAVNFDHPDALDFPLMARKLRELKSGKNCELPQYDFKTHKRLSKLKPQMCTPIIVVDGILILHDQEVRDCLDKAVYFQASQKLRFSRRLKRDVEERGRTEEGVRQQFERQVEPMHRQFVKPSQGFAHWTVDEGSNYVEIFHEVVEHLRKINPHSFSD